MKQNGSSPSGRSAVASPSKSPRKSGLPQATAAGLCTSKSHPNFMNVDNPLVSATKASYFKHSRIPGASTSVYQSSPTRKPPVVLHSPARPRESLTMLPKPLHTAEALVEYLDRNGTFLENYLMKRWTLEKVEHFLKRSLSPAMVSTGSKFSLRPAQNSLELESPISSHASENTDSGQSSARASKSTNKICNCQHMCNSCLIDSYPSHLHYFTEHETLIRNLARRIHTHHDKAGILVEMVSEVIKLADASGGNLYIADDEHENLSLYTNGQVDKTAAPRASPTPTLTNGSLPSIAVTAGTYVSAYVAHSREPLKIDDLSKRDERFPNGLFYVTPNKSVKSVIAYPLMLESCLIGVFEVYRFSDRPQFSVHHDSVIASFALWGSLTAKTLLLYEKITKQKELDDFILQITKYEHRLKRPVVSTSLDYSANHCR